MSLGFPSALNNPLSILTMATSTTTFLAYLQTDLRPKLSAIGQPAMLLSETNPLVPFQLTGQGQSQGRLLIMLLFVQPHPLIIEERFRTVFAAMATDSSQRARFGIEEFCQSAGITNLQAATWVAIQGGGVATAGIAGGGAENGVMTVVTTDIYGLPVTVLSTLKNIGNAGTEGAGAGPTVTTITTTDANGLPVLIPTVLTPAAAGLPTPGPARVLTTVMSTTDSNGNPLVFTATIALPAGPNANGTGAVPTPLPSPVATPAMATTVLTVTAAGGVPVPVTTVVTQAQEVSGNGENNTSSVANPGVGGEGTGSATPVPMVITTTDTAGSQVTITTLTPGSASSTGSMSIETGIELIAAETSLTGTAAPLSATDIAAITIASDGLVGGDGSRTADQAQVTAALTNTTTSDGGNGSSDKSLDSSSIITSLTAGTGIGQECQPTATVTVTVTVSHSEAGSSDGTEGTATASLTTASKNNENVTGSNDATLTKSLTESTATPLSTKKQGGAEGNPCSICDDFKDEEGSSEDKKDDEPDNNENSGCSAGCSGKGGCTQSKGCSGSSKGSCAGSKPAGCPGRGKEDSDDDRPGANSCSGSSGCSGGDESSCSMPKCPGNKEGFSSGSKGKCSLCEGADGKPPMQGGRSNNGCYPCEQNDGKAPDSKSSEDQGTGCSTCGKGDDAGELSACDGCCSNQNTCQTCEDCSKGKGSSQESCPSAGGCSEESQHSSKEDRPERDCAACPLRNNAGYDSSDCPACPDNSTSNGGGCSSPGACTGGSDSSDGDVSSRGHCATCSATMSRTSDADQTTHTLATSASTPKSTLTPGEDAICTDCNNVENRYETLTTSQTTLETSITASITSQITNVAPTIFAGDYNSDTSLTTKLTKVYPLPEGNSTNTAVDDPAQASNAQVGSDADAMPNYGTSMPIVVIAGSQKRALPGGSAELLIVAITMSLCMFM